MAIKNKHPEKRGYGTRQERKSDAKKVRRQHASKFITDEMLERFGGKVYVPYDKTDKEAS